MFEMYRTKFILTLTLSLFVAQKLNAQNCARPPSCMELGYTQTTTQCAGKEMLKCPFDQTAVYCGAIYDCASNGYTETTDKCEKDYVTCPYDKNKVRCLSSCATGSGSNLSNCSASNHYYDEKTATCVAKRPSGNFGCYVGKGKVAFANRIGSFEGGADSVVNCFKKDMWLASLDEAIPFVDCMGYPSFDSYFVLESLSSAKCYGVNSMRHTIEEKDCSTLSSYYVCLKDLKL